MSKPVFHPALDGLADEIEELRENAARYGVTVEEFCACMINVTASLLVRSGSSSEALNASMERAYAAHAGH